MRTTALALIAVAVVLVACGTTATSRPEPLSNSVPSPVDVQIAVDTAMSERLEIGLAMDIELRVKSSNKSVGECTLSFDLWEEKYRVAFTKTDVQMFPDAQTALRSCLDMARVQAQHRGERKSIIVVRDVTERRELYQPPVPAPVF